MRLTTWNVNGIRNPFSYPPWNTARTFPAMFDILGSDIVVMQELKIQRKDLRDDMVLLDGWDCYFSLPKHKKGYSGVGIYTRNATCAPIRAEEGLLGVLPSASGVPYRDLSPENSIGGYPTEQQIEELGVDPAALDAEGRCVVVQFPAFVLLGVYSPANSNGLRDDFRYGFICALDRRVRNLIKAGKRVVLVGDLNVSRHVIDTASAAEDIRKAGITHEDYISTPNRRIFNQLLDGGEVIGERDEGRENGVLWDTTRGFHPDRKGMYTHWEQKINARPGNFGSRIDFILVSKDMRPWVKDANIQEGLMGSDHCPVFIDFNELVASDSSPTKQVPLLDLMSKEGVFVEGERVEAWKSAHAPALSAKRMPEFDKRRSIKSMFTVPKQITDSSTLPEGNDPRHTVAFPETAASPKSLLAVKSSQSRLEVSPTKSTSVGSPVKRKSSAGINEPSSKRTKPETNATASKGQKSMTSFFKPMTMASSTLSSKASPAPVQAGDAAEFSAEDATAPEPGEPESPAASQSDFPTPIDIDAQLENAERTQKSWSSLFAKPAAPMCEGHNEPCKSMQTKKKGSNQGRSFWMCARPLGPSGNKERGTQWRCPTFIWCSDWTSGNQRPGNEELLADRKAMEM